MDFKEALKIWIKALLIFCAGFMAAFYAIILIVAALMKLKGSMISIQAQNFLMATIMVLVMAGVCFLIHWGWLRFRTGLPLETLTWKQTFLAGFAVLPILTLLSIPLAYLKIIALAPTFFQILLPVLCILGVSEGAAWRARLNKRAERAERQEPAA